MRKQIFIAAVLLLPEVICHAEEWNGHFKHLMGQDKNGRYERIIDITCEKNVHCTAGQSTQFNGQELPVEPIYDGGSHVPLKPDLPFQPDVGITKMFRRSIQDLAHISDFSDAPPYFKPEIYRQIGTPSHVVECRASQLLMICELDTAMVRDDDGNLTKWILLMPDMSSGQGCPGYGCPVALTRE